MADATTIKLITDSLTKVGITNTFVQSGIVGVVGEESSYVPKAEMSYKNTPNDRLRTIFGTRLQNYSDAQLTTLKANDVAFYDVIYGGQNGNTSAGDGWKYRGRGFNQITFKNLYQKYGNAIGVDLVNNPDRLNELPIAAAACAVYFMDTFKTAIANGSLKSKFGITDLSQVKDLSTGAKLALQANAGFGKDLNTSFFQTVYQKVIANATANPVATGLAIGVIIVGTLITFFFTEIRI